LSYQAAHIIAGQLGEGAAICFSRGAIDPVPLLAEIMVSWFGLQPALKWQQG